MWGADFVAWEKGELVWRQSGLGRSPTPRASVPSSAAWRAFWSKVDAIDAWSWRARYEGPKNLPPDAHNSWSVTIAHAGKVVTSTWLDAAPPEANDFRVALTELFAAGCPETIGDDAGAPR